MKKVTKKITKKKTKKIDPRIKVVLYKIISKATVYYDGDLSVIDCVNDAIKKAQEEKINFDQLEEGCSDLISFGDYDDGDTVVR